MLLWGKLKRMVWMKGGWVNWMKTEFSLNLRWIKIEYSKTYILFSLFSSSANMYLLRPSPWFSLFWMKKISKWEFLELPRHIVSSALFRYWCWGELSACTPEDHQIPRAIENSPQHTIQCGTICAIQYKIFPFLHFSRSHCEEQFEPFWFCLTLKSMLHETSRGGARTGTQTCAWK